MTMQGSYAEGGFQERRCPMIPEKDELDRAGQDIMELRSDSKRRFLKIALISIFCIGLLLVVYSLPLAFPGLPIPFSSRGVPAGPSLDPPSPEVPNSDFTGETGTPESIEPTQKNQIPANEKAFMIKTIDGKTQEPLGSVALFIDGSPVGQTSSDTGTLAAFASPDVVTIRATKPGYQETTIRADLHTQREVSIELFNSAIIPVKRSGPTESRIDVVFLPSDTSFNCTADSKVQLDGYPGGRQQFERDVNRVINMTFFKLDSFTSPDYPLPQNYQDKFNFYYFWDGKTYADAFDGCSGKIPELYWQKAPFADITVILYPRYYGTYSGSPCQPRGCTNPNGLGRVYLKVAANDQYLTLHEIGHALFGLVDTYCGNTYYIQNDPNPNVWKSEESCRSTAQKNNWNPEACQQISQATPVPCLKDFWRIDPSVDIMGEGYFGKFGNASTKRIINILDQVPN